MRRIVLILVILGAFPLQCFSADDDLTVAGFCSGTLSAQRKKTCTNASLELCGNDNYSACKVPVQTKASISDESSRQRVCGSMVTEANQNCQSKTLRPPSTVKDGGTKEVCEQYNTEVTSAQSQNEYLGGRCRAAIANCLANCASLSPSPITGFYKSNIDTCKGLAKNAELIEKQMNDLENGSLKAIDCSKLSSTDPKDSSDPKGDGTGTKDSNTKSKTANSGMGGMNPQSLMQMAQAMMQQNQDPDQTQPEAPAVQDCSANGMIAGCVQAATTPQSWNQATGEASASSNDDAGGDFNPTDIAGMQPASVNPQQQQVGAPMTNAAIPNGGGQMLGGGGSSSASLGGSTTGNFGVASAGKKVEVQTGGGGGGFSQTAANMNMKNGESGGGYNYGGRAPSSDGGFDLSSFLPGGKHDPFKGRGVAGAAAGSGNFQIQSKDVNLFSRISERIKSRCAQGLLRDCIP